MLVYYFHASGYGFISNEHIPFSAGRVAAEPSLPTAQEWELIMSSRHLIAAACLACLACLAAPSHAGIITLDPTTIKPGVGGQSNPTIVLGNGTVRFLVDKNMQPIPPDGIATAAGDGYQVNNFTYFVTAGKVGPIVIDFFTQESFSSNAASNITVAISGNMSLSLTGGTLRGGVEGLIDNNIVAPTIGFPFPPPPNGVAVITGPANNVAVPWNTSGIEMNVAKGANHTLNMFTELNWAPTAVGQSLTVSGSYTVTASALPAAGAVPEPSSFVLGAIGAATFGLFGLFRSRFGFARPNA